MITYEERLNQDERWALTEGSKHFHEGGSVYETLRKVAARLDELEVPYAVAGGLALFHHGVRRFTEDVHILVTREGLRKIHEALEGKGYLPAFRRSKNLRDTQTGVAIEFLLADDFPGDGKPKPVSFPDPAQVAHESHGIRYVGLENLVELKLASGISAPHRLKDLADVSSLIELLHLPQSFGQALSAYVRPKYEELWANNQTRYVKVWRKARHQADAALLARMQADGVTVEAGNDAERVYLVTTDPAVAERYDMHPESEYWGEPDED